MTTSTRTGAGLARHRSKQDIGTPANFIAAVQSRFGLLMWDLAATAKNAVCRRYLGPGSPNAENSLSANWLPLRGTLWLNPPFGTIEPWARKCASVRNRMGWTLLLVPSSTGAQWFQNWVVPYAHVIELTNRIQFVGSDDPYPKDLILACYGFGVTGRSAWEWDHTKKRRAPESEK